MTDRKKRRMRVVNALLCLSLTPLPVWADDSDSEVKTSESLSTKAPSQALLEFLADFSGTDDLTFNVILYHGLEDYEKQQAEPQAEADSTPQGSKEP